jgi:uncharacterized membrane protein YfcA
VTNALLASPLGLIVGVSLGLLGSGGSILAVPILVYAAGQSPQQATSTSLVLVAAAALSALRVHYRAGRVRMGVGITFGATGIGGSLLGTALNRNLHPDALLLAFSGLILIAAWRMVTGCPSCTRSGEARAIAEPEDTRRVPPFRRSRVFLFVCAGSAVGFLTGLFGVGGGFVIIPALTLLLDFTMPAAIGTSLLVVALNSVVAFAARAGAVPIDRPLAAAFTGMAVVGSMIGAALAGRNDAQRSLSVFASCLVVLAIFTATTALRGLMG